MVKGERNQREYYCQPNINRGEWLVCEQGAHGAVISKNRQSFGFDRVAVETNQNKCQARKLKLNSCVEQNLHTCRQTQQHNFMIHSNVIQTLKTHQSH